MSDLSTCVQAAALDKTVEYSRDLMVHIEQAPTFIQKLQSLILLYTHFYEDPHLLTNYECFREATWAKMNEQEVLLLDKRQTENNEDTHVSESVDRVLILIDSLRTKYW